MSTPPNTTPDFADLSTTNIHYSTQYPRLLKQVQRGPTDWVCGATKKMGGNANARVAQERREGREG